MSDSLRTLHVNTDRTFRGGERQVILLMQGLVERGHTADLAAQPGGELAERADVAGLTVHKVRMRGEADVMAMARIASLLREVDPHILHLHTGHAHTLGVAASLLTGRGRRIVSRRVVSPVGRNCLSRFKYRHGVDRYIAISEAVKRRLLEIQVPDERVRVVHSCIDPRRFEGVADRSAELRRELGIPDGAPVVGTVGALCHAKGFRHFIDAIPRVIGQVPEARFVLVGDGELRTELEKRAATLALADGALTFAGWRNDVPELLRLLDLFVSSSVEEGLGTSVMQAMLSGTPVVVTDAGGLPEVVDDGENGLVVPKADPAALADAMIRLLSGAETGARMADAGQRTIAERFTPDRMVEGTLAVYREVLAGKAPG